ncbi:unnamed protein product [Toxocara canis]|uniref:ACB domain-containing protein n=1 Tax=Toxocara canis TaxID=6265 RepID=A0A183U258_TOXCA|nr:unnamed protein product [Toxocara canis]
MDFETAAAKVNLLKTRPSNDELLELYGLYKQATVGDNTISKPWIDVKGRAKWDAWEGRKGECNTHCFRTVQYAARNKTEEPMMLRFFGEEGVFFSASA